MIYVSAAVSKMAPPRGPGGGMFRVLEATQVAKGAHVRKIDLERLDQALAHIGK